MRRFLIPGLLLGLAVAGTLYISLIDSNSDPVPRATLPQEDPVIHERAYLKRACNLPVEWARRIHRGWDGGPSRDWDLVIVPHPRNYMGTFLNTSHSGPYAFLQEVPLILYGPGFIEPMGRVEIGGEITLADVAPALADVMGFESFSELGLSPLREVFTEGAAEPGLIVTVSIDGGGWNVLERWARAWPFLATLIEKGVNIEGATVGTSPSITPAVHTTIGTGVFPREHGVTAIAVRGEGGSVQGAFTEETTNVGAPVVPDLHLRVPTIGDLWDRANGNRPQVGMLSSGNFPLGMLGLGTTFRGGDKDLLLMEEGGTWVSDERFYFLPDYVNEPELSPDPEVRLVDEMDGKADGEWLDHDLDSVSIVNSPVAALWQGRVVEAILDREGFGADDVTDLFYFHIKSPDHAGHKWNMIAPEQRDIISSVDRSMESLVGWLDEHVGPSRYLLVVTADHGQTPLNEGGWPIDRNEIRADISARFDRTNNGEGIIARTSATTFFSDRKEMKRNETTPEKVSSFLSDYTIGDNIPRGGDVPAGFEDRTRERIFRAVFPGRQMAKVARCAGALGE